MAAGDTAGKVVFDVEDGAVAVGDFGIQRQQVVVDRAAVDGRMDAGELFDGAMGPHRPVPQEPAADAHPDLGTVAQATPRITSRVR